MKRMLTIALVMAGVALLAGCPKKHNTKDYPTAGSQVPDASTSSSGDSASTSTTPLGGDAANGARGIPGEGTGALARKVIYFRFRQIRDQTGICRHHYGCGTQLERQPQHED